MLVIAFALVIVSGMAVRECVCVSGVCARLNLISYGSANKPDELEEYNHVFRSTSSPFWIRQLGCMSICLLPTPTHTLTFYHHT